MSRYTGGHETVVRSLGALPVGNEFLFRVYSAFLRARGKPLSARTYFGAEILCDPKELIDDRILLFGVWEPTISAVIESILGPGDTFVDLGANIGYDTLLGAHCVRSTGTVIAVEASPTIFEQLLGNISRNNLTNIRTAQVAVADEAGTLVLYEGPPRNTGRTTTVSGRGFAPVAEVEARSLDLILTPEERSAVRLIKVDIEGGEPMVIGRLLETLDLYPPTMDLIVEVSPSPEWSELFGRMLQAGFQAFGLENEYGRQRYLDLSEVPTPVPLHEAPPSQTDVLFTRQPAALKSLPIGHTHRY